MYLYNMQAAKLLFEEPFLDNPLFNSQLDLANSLLSEPTTKYYVDRNDVENYNKALTRLKTYISQLLSTSVTRTLTEDFKNGLKIVIQTRLKGDSEKAKSITEEVISIIQKKNYLSGKHELKSNVIEQFDSDFSSANYIAVITSRPIEIDDPEKNALSPLRKNLIIDLVDRLFDKEKDLKYYRFNFPVDTFALLFWRFLKRILIREFKSRINPNTLDVLYNKFAIKTKTLEHLNGRTPSMADLDNLVNETIELLNRNRYILVFVTSAPIYSVPLVAMDPSNTKHIKVYAMLQAEDETVNYYKMPSNELMLWRVFFWDALKAKKHAGQEVSFSPENV